MRDKSELRAEVLDLLRDIDAEMSSSHERLGRLMGLRVRGVEMCERLGVAPGDRGTVEQVGAWMDDFGLERGERGN